MNQAGNFNRDYGLRGGEEEDFIQNAALAEALAYAIKVPHESILYYDGLLGQMDARLKGATPAEQRQILDSKEHVKLLMANLAVTRQIAANQAYQAYEPPVLLRDKATAEARRTPIDRFIDQYRRDTEATSRAMRQQLRETIKDPAHTVVSNQMRQYQEGEALTTCDDYEHFMRPPKGPYSNALRAYQQDRYAIGYDRPIGDELEDVLQEPVKNPADLINLEESISLLAAYGQYKFAKESDPAQLNKALLLMARAYKKNTRFNLQSAGIGRIESYVQQRHASITFDMESKPHYTLPSTGKPAELAACNGFINGLGYLRAVESARSSAPTVPNPPVKP